MSTLKKSLCVAIALVCVIPVAFAAGFQLKEQSGSLQGLSFAGATAKADDASTIFYNPAGMTRLSDRESYASLSLIKPQTEFKVDTVTSATAGGGSFPAIGESDGRDAGGLSGVPSLYIVNTFDNGVKFGLSVNTPFGLKTDYDEDWVGRYYAIKSELLTINVSPNFAFKATDKLSLGAGLAIEYAEAELTNAINVDAILGAGSDGFSRLIGDSIGFGWRVGGLYEFDENTRVGIGFQSGIHHKLNGDIKVQSVGALSANPLFQNAEAQATLRTPDVLSIGFYHEVNPQWAIMADAAWSNWSVFENLIVSNRSNGLIRQNVEQNWDDSYFYAIGAEYHPYNCSNRTWQFGVAYDQTPTDDEYRTFRIPDEDRLWISFGYAHEVTPNKKFTIGYSHIFVEDSDVVESVDPAFKGVVSGSYDASVDILSANFSVKF
jgi:long-chain fatty acid transport protein